MKQILLLNITHASENFPERNTTKEGKNIINDNSLACSAVRTMFQVQHK